MYLFFPFSLGFILGWLHITYPHFYVLLTHSLLEPDGGESQGRQGKEINKTEMIKN